MVQLKTYFESGILFVIKIAHVGSIGCYKELISLSQINMFLAPLSSYSKIYEAFISEESNKKFTILDSGSFEISLGTEKKNFTEKEYLELSLDLGVHEIVCPDIPGNPSESRKATLSFIKYWKTVKYKKPNLMVVPHGKNLIQWLANAEDFIKLVDNCTIGIPRILSEMCNDNSPKFRLKIAQLIERKFPYTKIHLLGAGKDIILESYHLKSTKISNIRSMDNTFIQRYLSNNIDPSCEYAPPIVLKNNYKIENKNRVFQLLKYFE